MSKVDGISTNDLEVCLYSRATLSSLSLVLPHEAYSDWISEMTKGGLDYKNPVGVAAYSVFKDLCIVERNKSDKHQCTVEFQFKIIIYIVNTVIDLMVVF